MTQLGVVTITHPDIEKHVRRMTADNHGKPFAKWPHKVEYTQDGGGTWTFTCSTCDITWKKTEDRGGEYHGD